jgi:probable DNA repair protein
MTTVTANTRLARRLLREFDRECLSEGIAFWETPDILNWNAWLARSWNEAVYAGRAELLLLSPSQELVLWELSIRASSAGAELLNPAGTARAAAQAWQILHDWRIPRDEAAFSEIPDTAAFFEWMRSFQQSLNTRGFITAAQLPGALLQIGFDRPPVFAGFDELTPVQRSFFDGAEEFDLPVPVRRSSRCTALPDSEQEIRSSAVWARRHLETDPAARIGVVFPELSPRRLAVSRIYEEVLGTPSAFHISAPAALAGIPLIAAALLALKLCRGLSLAEAGALLRSPYFSYSLQEGARADASLRAKGIGSVTLANPVIARLFPDLSAPSGPTRPSAWSAAFSQLVRASGWPGRRTLSSVEFQVVEAWKDLLAEFARLDSVLGELDFPAALSRLERLATDTGFGAEEQDEPVQILGILEASGARFDALWVAGLHDAAWPPAGSPNPFIPLALQRAAGAPNSSIERQYSYAKLLHSRLLLSAPDTICSYPRLDGETALRPSPFLSGMASIEIPLETKPAPVPRWEQLTADPAPALTAGTFVHGGMSVIADQSACAFRAFAKHRLGARELDHVEPGLTQQEQGNVTHAALADIWLALRDRRTLLETGPADLHALIERCVRRAIDQKLGESSRSLTRMKAIETMRLTGLLRAWLEQEKLRPDFEALHLEQKHLCQLGGLQLEVRADRVDRYPDGSLAILDYKTGRGSAPSHWDTDRPEEPQLPLYSIMAEAPVSTVAFAQLAAGKLTFKGISDCGDSNLKPGIESRIGQWRNVLHALAGQFVEGRAAVDPRQRACQHCGLPGLCRKSGLEMQEESGDE